MTGLGIQTWVLPLIGIRSALAHSELMEVLEVIHILGNSYRLASSGVSSGIVYGRFTLDFCRIVAASMVWNAASPRSAFPAFERRQLNVGPKSLEAWTVPTGDRDPEDNSWLIG